MKRKLLTFAGVCLMLVLSVAILIKPSVAGADFNPNDIMDDYVFDNVNSMSANQIDTFLNTFPNSCISLNHGFQAIDPAGFSPSAGFTFGGNVSAGTVILHAAQAYGLNPQVLIVTLQKEQSLVTGGAGCSTLAYAAATGYGCPDGGTTYNYSGVNLYTINGNTVTSVNGTCVNGSTRVGFSQQLIRSSWLLRFGEQRSYGNTGWAVINGSWDNSDDLSTCYGGPMTQGMRARCPNTSPTYFDGYYTIDGSTVHIDNGPTAALYWYTPHFAGNQHFDTIFLSWFGATTGQGFSKVISDDPNDLRQWVVYGSIKQYIPDSQTIYAWNLQNVPLTTMPASQLSAIATGPTFSRLTRVNTDPSTIYFVDGGKRYTVPWQSMIDTWNIGGLVINSVSVGLFNQVSDGGSLSYFVKDPGSSTIYMLDGGNNSGQTILRPYQSAAVFHAWEGDNANYISISSDYFGVIDNAIGATLTNTKITFGGNQYEVNGGGRMSLGSNISSLYPGTAQAVSSATFNRLVGLPSATYLVRSASSPTLYLLDAGTKHHVLWPDLAVAWNTPGTGVTVVGDTFLTNINAGSDISSYFADVGGQLYVIDGGVKLRVPASLDTAYRHSGVVYNASADLMTLFVTNRNQVTGFVKGRNSGAIYLIDNTGQLRHLEWADKVSLYGGYSVGITELSDTILNGMAQASSPQIFVTDGTTKYVIENGNKWSVASGIQTDWGLLNPQSFTDGTLDRFALGGALDNKLTDGHGAFYLIRGGTSYGTTDANIANIWGLSNAPVHDPRLIGSFLRNFMLTRYVRSSANGDSRTFAIDGGNWTNVPQSLFSNMTWGSEPVMSLNPSFAPNQITDWPGVVVKDGHGNFYVIDGGGKRYFANSVIVNQWTNFGNITAPTVSNSFLALFPTRGTIERAIKGTGPSVYSAENGAKRHILYPDTYNLYYAPFCEITDNLLNAMPAGSDIQ